MQSNWQTAKAKSNFHFDPFADDTGVVVSLGKFVGEWSNETESVISSAQPATWATRGYKHKGDVSPDIESEEYDLTVVGAAEDLVVCRMEWEIPPTFQKMADMFALEDCYSRIHVQFTGEVFNLHIDKLQKWNPEDPAKVMRFVIHLNDWSMGQFSQFGNYNHMQWHAGDVYTFDWANIPHCAANAGYDARALMIVTGIATDATYAFLDALAKGPVTV